MFTHLRQSAQGFFAKLILFLLVAMFALWGIGDVFRTMGMGPANVATVGKTPITMQQYHNALKRAEGQPQRALMGLISDLLIEKEENAMGIAVNDDAVANYLSTLPEFRGADGQFDKAAYAQLLARSGRSEADFVENIRRQLAREMLIGTLVGGVQVPDEMVRAVYKMEEEQRAADIMIVTSASVAASVPKPTEQEIKAYYDANPKNFTVPEVRTLSYVILPIADVEAKIDVPEEEIKRAYEEHKEDFRTQEKRQVENLEFDNEQDAKDAAKELKSGTPFAQVAKSALLANKGKTALGFISAQDLPQEAVNQVFSLKAGGMTDPVLAKFRWHIYRVYAIEPGKPQTLAEARPAIAKDIASRGAQETAQKMMNGFEDTLAGGASLAKAAEKIGQKVYTVGPITREGNTPQGEKAELPPYDNFLVTAFTTAEKDHSQGMQAADGSYFLVQVDGVTPEHVRPLAQVKEEAAKGAMAEKVSAKLMKAAQDMSAKLRAGKKPDDAPKPAAASGLKRDSQIVADGALKGKSVPAALLSELFRVRLHDSTHAYPTDDGDYMIATLEKITPAPQPPKPEALEAIRKELLPTLTDEMLQRYLAYLRGKYPVTIDTSALGVKDEQGGE